MKIEPLSELELETYTVIQELLNNHRLFSLEDIIPKCYNLLNPPYSNSEISRAIQGLIHKRYIIKGTSLTRDDVFQNAVRKRILSYIQINPGAYNRKIRRECSLGSNEFKWHLGMLIKFGFVKKIQFTTRSCGYFENREYMGHEMDLFLLQNDKVAKIIEYLSDLPSSISVIARKLEIHYNTVQKYVLLLEEREILKSTQEKDNIIYSVNEDMLVRLRKIVNGQVFLDFASDV
ncbi:MAG: hypothetical protein ACTSX0_03110 [Promethearchaeota archaeon]